MSDKVIQLETKPNKAKIFVIVVTIVVLIAIFLIFGLAKIQEVTIEGETRYEKSEICNMLQIREGSSFVSAYLKKRAKVTLLPFVEKVDISFPSLNRAVIMVREKEITSFIPFQNQYVALDKEGYVVGYEKERKDDIPVSIGIKLEEATIGKKVPIDDKILDSVLVIYFAAKKYDMNISDISFLQGKADQIHIYRGDIDISLGNSEDIDMKMQTAKKVIEGLPKGTKGKLDLRYGSKSYVFKKDFSLFYYVKTDRGYYAIDRDYYIKKISQKKFTDGIIITNLDGFTGEEDKIATIEESKKKVIEEAIKACEVRHINLEELDFNYKQKRKFGLITKNVAFDMINTKDLDAKINVCGEYIENLKKRKVIVEDDKKQVVKNDKKDDKKQGTDSDEKEVTKEVTKDNKKGENKPDEKDKDDKSLENKKKYVRLKKIGKKYKVLE